MVQEIELKLCMCKESVQKVIDQLDSIKVKAEETLKAVQAVYDAKAKIKEVLEMKQ